MKAQKIVISVLVALATVICGVFSLDKEWWKHASIYEIYLRNEAVKKEIQDIMTFWLDKGVSGFRVDAPMMFMEDEQLRDNPPLKSIVTAWTVFEECERTINHPESYKFVNELNVFLRKYDRESGKPIQTALLGETYGPINQVVKYYGTKKFPAFHIPFNFLLQFLTTYQNARGLHDYLHTWLDKVPKGMTSNWVMGNHDQGRIAGNLNSEYNYILLAITTMLPGASTVYYGEELGLAANKLVSIKDIYNRFSHRTPMQWDDSRNAGFSTAEKPWTPLHPNYWHMNVQTQRTDINSTLNYFKDLMSLRKTDTMIYGDLKFYIISEWVLAFSRASKQTGYIIVMNLGTETEPMDWPIEMNHFSITLTVVASSPNSGYKKGFKIKTRGNYPLTSVLRPHSIVILSSSDIH